LTQTRPVMVNLETQTFTKRAGTVQRKLRS